MSHIEANSNSTINQLSARTIPPAFDMQVDFFNALSAGDIDKAANTFAADGTLLFPGLRPVQGRALVKRMLGIIRRRYDTIEWHPTGPTIGSDGWMVTSWSVSGTFKDSALLYDNEVLSLVRLDADGLISMLSDYFKDTLAFQPSRSQVAMRSTQESPVTQSP